jgi:hypothetical protein
MIDIMGLKIKKYQESQFSLSLHQGQLSRDPDEYELRNPRYPPGE